MINNLGSVIIYEYTYQHIAWGLLIDFDWDRFALVNVNGFPPNFVNNNWNILHKELIHT